MTGKWTRTRVIIVKSITEFRSKTKMMRPVQKPKSSALVEDVDNCGAKITLKDTGVKADPESSG